MGQTTYDSAVAAIVEKLTGREYEVYQATRRRLRAGFYDTPWVDAIFQSGYHRDVTLETAYCFAQLWTQIRHGQILTTVFDVDLTPGADAQLDAQRDELLARMNEWLPTEMSERLGGYANGVTDGWIRFPEGNVTMREGDTDVAMTNFVTPISLEIGSQSAAKTLGQIRSGRLLARWPYESRLVWVFYSRESIWQNNAAF